MKRFLARDRGCGRYGTLWFSRLPDGRLSVVDYQTGRVYLNYDGCTAPGFSRETLEELWSQLEEWRV